MKRKHHLLHQRWYALTRSRRGVCDAWREWKTFFKWVVDGAKKAGIKDLEKAVMMSKDRGLEYSPENCVIYLKGTKKSKKTVRISTNIFKSENNITGTYYALRLKGREVQRFYNEDEARRAEKEMKSEYKKIVRTSNITTIRDKNHLVQIIDEGTHFRYRYLLKIDGYYCGWYLTKNKARKAVKKEMYHAVTQLERLKELGVFDDSYTTLTEISEMSGECEPFRDASERMRDVYRTGVAL